MKFFKSRITGKEIILLFEFQRGGNILGKPYVWHEVETKDWSNGNDIVFCLGSTINLLQKHNKVEDHDNSQLQPRVVVQFVTQPRLSNFRVNS